MNPPVLLASVYLVLLGAKAALALAQRGRERPAPAADLARVTLLQPITSGDPTLADTLFENLVRLPGARFIWMLDRRDAAAQETARELVRNHPAVAIRVLLTDEPPPRTNPKLWKQAAALPLVETEFVAVVDDDTRLPRRAVDQLVAECDAGADLATGLPCYVPAPGRWSRLLAEFVNSSAILTYLPAAAVARPRSINGMCYLLRTAFVRQHALFTRPAAMITDDLAIAQELRRLGGRIVQTSQPHFIRTTVASATHFRRLMHRWFVFIRILVRHEPWWLQLVLGLVYGLPPLVLTALFGLALAFPSTGVPALLVVLLVRAALIMIANVTLTGAPRHAPVGSILTELLQPAFSVAGWVFPVIRWRHRRIRVQPGGTFDYLSP